MPTRVHTGALHRNAQGVGVQVDDLARLIEILPDDIKDAVQALPTDALLEIILDLGRIPQARLVNESVALGERTIEREDLAYVIERVGEFNADNRAGIEQTLHRISAIRNRKGEIIGLTLRVGRAVFGTIDILKDLVESGLNILLLGRPGVGKTTKLREIARVLADDYRKRVIVIDTSNEIAGEGDIPHPAIGSVRRMQVPHPDRQHAVMIEAVENHMPEVIIVDEIGTEAEAHAVRTIAERGVQLIATAHGNTLENLVMNPTLSDLVGGVHTVTLGDEEAKRRGCAKTISERRSPPSFDIIVEMVDRDEVIVHRDAAQAVDTLLAGNVPYGERRERAANGQVHVQEEGKLVQDTGHRQEREGPVRIYPYAISRDIVDRVIRNLGVDARTVGRPEHADLVLALRSRAHDLRLKRVLDEWQLPLHLIKKNTANQIRRVLQDVFYVLHGVDEEEVREAVREVEFAVQRVLSEGVAVALAPRRASIRKLQHRIISRYQLAAESVGKEPMRHLLVHPS